MPRSVRAKSNPDLLLWARKSAGFSLEEAARRIGKKFHPDRLAKWESGVQQPTVAQLRKLSEIYRRPLAVFYLQTPPYEFPVPHDFRRLPDEEIRDYSPRLRLELRLAQERRQVALLLLEEMEERPKEFSLQARLDEDPVQVGVRARRALGIEIEHQIEWRDRYLAMRSWRAAIERLGVLVFQVSEIDPSEMRGFSIFDQALPIIAINRSGRESPNARSFSMMHEFSHLMLRLSSVCDFEETNSPKSDLQKTEAFCNRVASEILVPMAHFSEQPEIAAYPAAPREWDDETIATLATRYCVSREVIARKLQTAGRATTEFYRRKREQYRTEYAKARESKPGGPENFGEKRVRLLGPTFSRLVLDSYYNGKLTLSEALGHLGTKVNYLESIEQFARAA